MVVEHDPDDQLVTHDVHHVATSKGSHDQPPTPSNITSYIAPVSCRSDHCSVASNKTANAFWSRIAAFPIRSGLAACNVRSAAHAMVMPEDLHRSIFITH
jgi:hypothetical protein